MARYRCGAEEARTRLPDLLERAHRGVPTVITKRGKPYAVVVPVAQAQSAQPRLSVLALKGSGRGMWGPNPSRTIAELRDEWE